MTSLETSMSLKAAAEAALAEGDLMTAMDLFGDAAERAYEEGKKELADECAFKVRSVIAMMAKLDGIDLPKNLVDK